MSNDTEYKELLKGIWDSDEREALELEEMELVGDAINEKYIKEIWPVVSNIYEEYSTVNELLKDFRRDISHVFQAEERIIRAQDTTSIDMERLVQTTIELYTAGCDYYDKYYPLFDIDGHAAMEEWLDWIEKDTGTTIILQYAACFYHTPDVFTAEMYDDLVEEFIDNMYGSEYLTKVDKCVSLSLATNTFPDYLQIYVDDEEGLDPEEILSECLLKVGEKLSYESV